MNNKLKEKVISTPNFITPFIRNPLLIYPASTFVPLQSKFPFANA